MWQTVAMTTTCFDNQETVLSIIFFGGGAKFSDSIFLNVNVFCFLNSSLTVNRLCLGCGQNKTCENVFVGFRKHWSTFFTILWHFMDRKKQLINCENSQQTNQLSKLLLSALLHFTSNINLNRFLIIVVTCLLYHHSLFLIVLLCVPSELPQPEPEPTKRLHSSESHSDNENNSNLSEIQQSTFTDKNSFRCDTCGKNFKQRFRWQRHLRIHTHKRTFACKACGKVFAKSSNLKVHMRIHTGEKPYSCKTCGKNFRYSSALKVHMRIHTGEKLYTCKTCGRSFIQNGSLESQNSLIQSN